MQASILIFDLVFDRKIYFFKRTCKHNFISSVDIQVQNCFSFVQFTIEAVQIEIIDFGLRTYPKNAKYMVKLKKPFHSIRFFFQYIHLYSLIWKLCRKLKRIKFPILSISKIHRIFHRIFEGKQRDFAERSRCE